MFHLSMCSCPLPAGFIAGERANQLSKMQPEAAVQKFLDQLNDMFGSAEQPRPASAAYVKAHIFDWAQEPYVGGAYSFPSLGAQDGDREALAAPVAGTIFFAGVYVRECMGVWGCHSVFVCIFCGQVSSFMRIPNVVPAAARVFHSTSPLAPPIPNPPGEATHTSVNPCMQAALETGQRAATQVLAALGAPTSRL